MRIVNVFYFLFIILGVVSTPIHKSTGVVLRREYLMASPYKSMDRGSTLRILGGFM